VSDITGGTEMCSPNIFISEKMLFYNELIINFKGNKPRKDNIMKNLIIFVLGVLNALLVGFIGTCCLFVGSSGIDVDLDFYVKQDKNKE